MRAQRLVRWLSLLLVGAFALLALDSLQMLGRYQAWGRSALEPLAWLSSAVADHAGSTWAGISAIGDLERENQRLRGENAQLRSRNLELEALGRENADLRQLLGFTRAQPGHRYHPATVIARGTNNLQPMLTLDQGAQDGLQEGMAVVDAGGLVGRITRLGPHVAVVQPIDNAGSAVAAYVHGKDASTGGMVVDEPGVGLLLQFVQATAPVQQGDWIVTSGLGGTFPRDLPIATVREIRQRPVDLFQVALLRPAADLARDQVVLVVTDFVPQPLPQVPS